MTPSPSHVWAVPELVLVVCPPDPDPWNSGFYVLYSTVFLKHDEKIRECGFTWALSDELRTHLLCEFPWNAVNEIGWVRDIMVTFPGWLEIVTLPSIEHHPDVQAEPDIVPSHVGDGTKQAWLDVLADCVQEDTALSRVASYPQQPVVHLRVLLDEGVSAHVELVRQIAEWDVVLAQIDPWARHRLPRAGEYPYEPPDYWQPGQPFPRGHTARGAGFVDTEGRIWVRDRAESHWDVQDRRQGRERYTRVTNGGERLG